MPIAPGSENLRAIDAMIDGRFQTVLYPRYDRATDTLADVPPDTIEKVEIKLDFSKSLRLGVIRRARFLLVAFL